ncbi:MAG: MurR/RpiR family transcriptional regulator [Geothrix sp.]|uniref:MurR/RpiR family transcriptional regulator n=1 Tax=Geothrix sp. TaxID=1962974 RepID=UPI003BAE16AB
MSATKNPLLNRLHSAQGLSPSQRQIADCLIANMNEAPLWGVEELARKSQTCVATVVRFAKKLEYSGYLEMRKALVTAAKKHYGRGEQLLQAPVRASATLLEVARRDIRNLETLVQNVNEDLLKKVVQLIKSSRMRLAIGDGVSALMTRQLAYLLINTGLPVIEGNPADFATQVGMLDSKDLVIAIAITPYTQETLDAAAYARKRGIPVLAFTDTLNSPLAKSANLTLPIPGENLLFSHSVTTFGVLVHAIATAIASQDPQLALKKLREVERVALPKFAKS